MKIDGWTFIRFYKEGRCLHVDALCPEGHDKTGMVNPNINLSLIYQCDKDGCHHIWPSKILRIMLFYWEQT